MNEPVPKLLYFFGLKDDERMLTVLFRRVCCMYVRSFTQ